MLQPKELIELAEMNGYILYVTNNREYAGIKGVKKEKFANFEAAVRANELTAERWDRLKSMDKEYYKR